MPGTDWVFRLRDQMSGPAGSIESQLRRVSTALKQLDMAAKQSQIARTLDPLRRQRLELQLQRDKLVLSKRALDDHTRSSKEAAKAWRDSPLLKWAGSLYILDTISRAFRAVGRAAFGMGEQIKDAVERRQGNLFGLKAMMGAGAGSSLFGQLSRQAQLYGRPDTVDVGASLADLGAPAGLVGAMVAARSDVLARTNNRVDIADQMRDLLRHPVGSVGQLEGLSSALGGDPNRLRSVLARRLTQSSGQRVGRGDVDTILGTNKVPAAMMQESVLEALQGMGNGPLGALAMNKASQTLEGATGRVQAAWNRLLGSLSESRGIKTLQDVLQNLAATLGSAAVRKSLTDLANTLGDALKPLTGAEGRKRMEDFFTSLAKQIQETLPYLKTLVEQLGTMFGGVAGVGKWYANIFKLMSSSTPANERLKAADAILSPLTPSDDVLQQIVQDAERRGQPSPLVASPLVFSRSQSPRPLVARPLVFHGPLAHVDARGATAEDAGRIGEAVETAVQKGVNTLLERLATEQGSSP